jgi:ATP-dependent DNA helicase RecG
LAASFPNLGENREADVCLISDQLSQALRFRLEGMASDPRAKGKGDRQVLISAALQLCEGRFLTLRCLAELVKRKPDTLRDQYLKTLVRQRQLNLAFPTTPNLDRQAYTSVKPSTP